LDLGPSNSLLGGKDGLILHTSFSFDLKLLVALE